jgi:transposase, IS5 family
MNAVIPWGRLLKLIEPHYPKPGKGRRPLGLEKMLRIYFLQQWFDLSDPAAEDAIYDSESMRRFVGVEVGEDTVPDESSILRFRHLLEEHDLTRAIFEEVRGLLEEKGLLVKQGTIVDATVLAAPMGYAELLRDGMYGEVNEIQQRHLREISSSAHLLVDIIEDILTLARLEAAREAAEVQLTDLAALTRDTIGLLRI